MDFPPTDIQPPLRPNFVQLGRPIFLKANHFQVKILTCILYHYDIAIQPDKCPRRVNREIRTRSEYFGDQKPVFDGKKNLYSRKPMPGIGRDRVEIPVTLGGGEANQERIFKVSVKYIAQVNLQLLENVLRGDALGIPFDSIQALDVFMRHLPS